ncbi:MAG: hypothetical protein Q9194_007111 [Teloschistes cf. exilis]
MASQQPVSRPSSSRQPSSSPGVNTASPHQGRSSPSHSTHSEDSQTVVLKTPTRERSPSERKETPKQAKQQPQTLPADEPRKCWICFSDETEDSHLSSEWRSPCPCALTAHEACLLDWVADREAPQQNGSAGPQKIECPQCKSEIRIARPRSGLIAAHRSAEEAVRRIFWPGIVASLVTGMGAAAVLHGASTVYLILGTHDAEYVLGVRYGRMPSANTLLGLASVPGLLMLSCMKVGDSILPILPIVYLATNRPTHQTKRIWPPSVAMTLSTLPYLHTVYKGFMRKTFQERQKKWARQIQPRAGEEGDNAGDGTEEAAPEEADDGGALNFELGVELEIIEEDEAEIQPGLEQPEGDNDVVPDLVDAEMVEQGPDQIQDAVVEPQGNAQNNNDQGQNQRPQADHQHAPEAAQNAMPAPLAEQHRVIRLVPLVSAFVHTMIGALAFPAVAAGMGGLISIILPRTWKVPPGRWDRRSHGFLQTRFGRSVLGGCLFLVLKDTLSLYSKYRLAQDHMQRRILDYEGKDKVKSPMSLGSGLRIRKDMGGPHFIDDDEDQVYLLSPAAENDGTSGASKSRRRKLLSSSRSLRPLVIMVAFTFFVFVFAYYILPSFTLVGPPRCIDTPERGYQCEPQITHNWGQYSPFFSVPSDISDDVPPGCKITFAQVLSRHGARDPTASKTKAYNSTIQKIQANVPRFPAGKYNFLNTFEYTLGADQLTLFGEREMINSGIAFYDRYEQLAKETTPFIRSSGEARVVESAQNFSQGFHQAKTSDKVTDTSYPYPILIIPEADGINNTDLTKSSLDDSLNHGLCTAFESSPTYTTISSLAQKTFLATFLPAITLRLNTDLPTANITPTDTITLLDLCPFTTVATPLATSLSPFCYLFTAQEFLAYSYYQSLGKYYGYGPGNPLGPTQGVGFVNELIARMTNTPVIDHTSVNHTLDDDNSEQTFPLESKLYVDVSHDNDMTSIFSALGLFNNTAPLSNTSIQSTDTTNGYSAASTVPFAARAYFEKMGCAVAGATKKEEFVRILVNGRVMPLKTCGGDALGRCPLDSFVQSLSFARAGGKWDLCFPKNP